MHLALLVVALSAAPAPARVVERAADGRLLRASALGEPPRGGSPEEAARAFVALRAAELGVGGRHGAVAERAPAAGRAGAVLLRRTVDGLPVLNGAIHVVVDAAGSVQAVRASDVPPAIAGAFALSEADAAARAAAALGPAARLRGRPAVRRAFWAAGRATVPVYEVDAIADAPAGAWRSVVDAASGAVLVRRDLRLDAAPQGRVYDFSPVETASGAACPTDPARPDTYQACATPVLHDLPNLSSASALAGSQVSVFNCRGTQFPTAPGSTGACTQLLGPLTNGAFDFTPDATGTDATDDFAAVMAYYHLDRHYTFVKGLDPAIAQALKPLPAFVNAFDGTGQPFGPYENSHFDRILGGMVFGQGRAVDYAYDATVAYHEQDHGVVFWLGDFDATLDAQGAVAEPGALHEGVADALAVAHTGKSELGFYIANHDAPPQPFLRDLANQKACQSTGAIVSQLGATGVVDGLDGEVHDDGEVWGGFYWELSQALAAAGVRACGGACDAAAAIQLQAVSLAAPGSPTLASFARDMVDAAGIVFPGRADVTDLVSRVAERRGLAACDRTLRLCAGERKAQAIDLRYGPFQLVVEVVQAPALVEVCSARGTAGARVWARHGTKVELQTFAQDPTVQTTAPGSTPTTVASLCRIGEFDAIRLPAKGTWYLLAEAPAASGDGFLFKVAASPAFTARVQGGACAAPPPAGSGGGGGGGGCGVGGGGLALLALVPLWLARRRLAGARR